MTVDASKRLSLQQVKNAEWIMCADVPSTPLMTPGYLKDQKVASTVKLAVDTTFYAYRYATYTNSHRLICPFQEDFTVIILNTIPVKLICVVRMIM